MQGVTGIRLFGGEKCFIKSRIKASSPHAGAGNEEALMFDLVYVYVFVKSAQNRTQKQRENYRGCSVYFKLSFLLSALFKDFSFLSDR